MSVYSGKKYIKKKENTMETIQRRSASRPSGSMAWIAAFLFATGVVLASSVPVCGAQQQMSFPSPEDAVNSLVKAVQAKDKAALNLIFGSAGKELRSGDEVQDDSELKELSGHLSENASLVKESETRAVLHVGRENWPFPIPIAKDRDRWFFDTEAGQEEILNRRIGENELTAILVCKSYVRAQREYVLKDWDGDGVLAYAQKLRSDPGRRNGLYWKAAKGEAMSPLGELLAKARMEGYRKKKAAFKGEKPEPFHGYYFKILTRQGRSAPGGKYSYIINGNMVGGFALVAFPSNWGKSGIMTFVVNQQGKVYQKNLGPNTLKIAQQMKTYRPNETWTPAKED